MGDQAHSRLPSERAGPSNSLTWLFFFFLLFISHVEGAAVFGAVDRFFLS